jgi:hypothetical protein
MGRVVGVTFGGGLHSIPDTQAIVELSNSTPNVCRVDAYRVEWRSGLFNILGGAARCKPQGATLAPHGSGRDSCTVSAGGISTLTEQNARVLDIESRCDGVR